MAKKIYMTEKQLNYLTDSKGKKNNFRDDYIKADRKGRRESDREIYGDGFKSNTKISKSQKSYSRKGKNQNWKNFSFDD